MKAIKGMRQYLAEGLQLEKSGSLPEAAMSFEKVVDSDPSNQEAVARLLIIYRKLKEYRKELAVIDNAIGAYQEKDKAIRENWLRAHPGAAGAGKAMLRSLGGGGVSAFGSDPVVSRLVQRRELVERKIGGGAVKRKSPTRAAARPSTGSSARKKQAKDKREAVAAAARKKAEDRKAEREAAAAARSEAAELRRQREEEKREAAAARAQRVAAKKAAARVKA